MKRQISTTCYGKLINHIGRFCFILSIVLIVAVGANAQGGVPENPDEPVPIDGGISLLVAAGVGYGIKKVHDARKKKLVVEEDK